jgi:signal transduction histidine kinase
VRGQADALHILFSNLIDNAVRYTPEAGVVEVDVHPASDAVIAEVRDTGPGIADDERERVFDRFYRGTASEGAAAGSGLGLAIVRQIAATHCATVELDSSAGSGLTVRVRFAALGARVSANTTALSSP